MSVPVLLSIQVGLPRTIDPEDDSSSPWTTSLFKEPVHGPIHLGWTHLDGDGQADTVNHGGPEKAVCAYSADHYDDWRRELELPALPFGGFGENFTIGGLTEVDVCIGDVWMIGAIAVQVSQPQQPCWKLIRRWQAPDIVQRIVRTGRTGWYFRVVAEGTLSAPLPLVLADRPFPEWTIERVNRAKHLEKDDIATAAALTRVPLLSPTWRASFGRRLASVVA